VFDEYITDVPEDEWHRPPWQCGCFFCIIPRISIAVYSASAIAIDMYPLSSDYETSVVILERNGIGIVSPVIEII
jgi:hypothetical protein